MSEARMWTFLREKMTNRGLFVQRFTDRIAEGIPDTCWQMPGVATMGWLEMKYLPRWERPKKLGLRQGQGRWLSRWHLNGGNAHLLVRVISNEWYLFEPTSDPFWAVDIEGSIDRRECERLGLKAYWDRGLPPDDFLKMIGAVK